ncbi:DoxX family protein [Thalassoglobus sp. JC818]|uniref:DoxX family protein n=1 Tax=Thalassoglobus sp. JC818 TaxID=3232136 RepID=UPI00345A84D0
MSSKNLRIVGWVLSILLVAFLIFGSAMGKFTEWEGKAEMFDKMGWKQEVMHTVGIVEVVIAILFLIPHTAFVAAILLAGYLGGATATHVRIEDSFLFPIIIGVVAWIALGLRQPDVFRLAFRGPNASSEQASKTEADKS